MRRHGLAVAVLAAGVVVGMAGCDSGTTEPEIGATQTLTVDASTEFAYVALGDPATEVTVADPSTDAGWDLGFFMTGVALNGGAGAEAAGDVVGFCVCQNAAATDAQVIAMTAEAEVDAFEAVTAAAIPSSEAAWSADVFDSEDAGRKWYRYNLEGTHLIYPTYNVYLIRTGEAVYKVQLVGYYDDEGQPRHITFRYARLD